MALKILSEETEPKLTVLPEEDRVGLKILPEEQKDPYKPPELPYMAKHPNLYAVEETAKDMARGALHLIPYAKYFDPKEREKFMSLTGNPEGGFWDPKTKVQAQVRELLKENLFAELLLAPMTKGGKYISSKAGEWFSKTFPKTYKTLTKPRMVSQLAKEEAAIEAAKQTPEVQKITQAIKEAKPLRKEQERLYTQERAKRLGKLKEVSAQQKGEAGYYEKLKELKGPLVESQFESPRPLLNQTEVDTLFNTIETGELNQWEKLPASRGLAKLLGEFGGKVPTEGELAKLETVFGREFVKAALDKRTLFTKYKEVGMQVANIPRAVMASFDFSAPLRQGVFLIGRPKRFFTSVFKSFKPFFSERTYQGIMEEIFSRPTAELMKESGLSLTHLGRGLKGREEMFMSNLAERLPIIGRGVRASERAYVSFLNKMRADVFDDLVKKGTELGIKDPKFFKDTARYINTATGRGELKFGFNFEPAAEILNTWFFSPRLIASRINLLRPSFYVGLEPTVRKEALKDLMKFGSIALGTGGLAMYGGANVEMDPTSADFMKIRFGNTRYDILGGFQQPVRLAAQLISGKVKSSTTGKTMVLGEGYRALTRPEIALRYLEYKQAPVVSFGVGLLRGKNALGEKFDIPTEVANRFIPMVAQDMKDLYQEKGLEGIAMASPAILGVGVQTYGGVQSFGLNGKNYPKLNTELLRLKTSMGYPSTMAFGYSLTNKEYKALKKRTGKEVANSLNKLLDSERYKQIDDVQKVRLIEHRIDVSKEKVKYLMFKDKKRKSKYKTYLEKSKGITGEEAEEMAEKYIKRSNNGK